MVSKFSCLREGQHPSSKLPNPVLSSLHNKMASLPLPLSSSASKVGGKTELLSALCSSLRFSRLLCRLWTLSSHGLHASSAHFGRVQGASSVVSPRVQGFTTSHSELGPALHQRQFVVAPYLYCLPLPSHLINQTFQLSTDNTLSHPSSRSQTPSPQTFTLRYRFTPLDFPNGARLCPF